jgi:hypothetical protein
VNRCSLYGGFRLHTLRRWVIDPVSGGSVFGKISVATGVLIEELGGMDR